MFLKEKNVPWINTFFFYFENIIKDHILMSMDFSIDLLLPELYSLFWECSLLLIDWFPYMHVKTPFSIIQVIA